jgi:hypothetical protein
MAQAAWLHWLQAFLEMPWNVSEPLHDRSAFVKEIISARKQRAEMT